MTPPHAHRNAGAAEAPAGTGVTVEEAAAANPSAADPAGTPPADYTFLLPSGWFRIDLDPERRDASVAALVERQFRGVDDAPLLKAQSREELRARAEEAFRNGGIELYLSFQSAGPLTVPGSLLVTLTSAPHPGTVPVEDLAGHLAGTGPVGREVSVEELPCGRSVRVHTRTLPAADDPSGNLLPVTSVDYHVPVPGSDAYLLLSFSTPLDPVADLMTDLFDAVAHSLMWRG